jgi:predicted ATPase
VSWENLSDGTLCLLALATVLKQTERYEEVSGQPALNLIEEPENSLYIGTIQTIWERLSSFAPRSQVVFTSHSPYFIDLFDRDLDSVTRLKKEGDVTTASSLRAYEPRIRQLREDFSLGELHFKDVFG